MSLNVHPTSERVGPPNKYDKNLFPIFFLRTNVKNEDIYKEKREINIIKDRKSVV
jgi:hypothetical protein